MVDGALWVDLFFSKGAGDFVVDFAREVLKVFAEGREAFFYCDRSGRRVVWIVGGGWLS